MELSETLAAKREIDSAGEDVFKIIGQLMIKTDKEKVKKELENKEKLLGIRINSFEKQESIFLEKIESLRSEIIG